MSEDATEALSLGERIKETRERLYHLYGVEPEDPAPELSGEG